MHQVLRFRTKIVCVIVLLDLALWITHGTVVDDEQFDTCVRRKRGLVKAAGKALNGLSKGTSRAIKQSQSW